jgi:hypothetical protein
MVRALSLYVTVRKLEEEFPEARAFVRPGFDTLGGIIGDGDN